MAYIDNHFPFQASQEIDFKSPLVSRSVAGKKY